MVSSSRFRHVISLLLSMGLLLQLVQRTRPEWRGRYFQLRKFNLANGALQVR